MKALIASHREDKRYLTLKGFDLKKNVKKALIDFLGELGYSKVSPAWIIVGEDEGILCINRSMINYVRASFVLFKKEIKIMRVSGTLKKLKK